eukprot:361100-Chlamydomonas_euryale.AAC.19
MVRMFENLPMLFALTTSTGRLVTVRQTAIARLPDAAPRSLGGAHSATDGTTTMLAPCVSQYAATESMSLGMSPRYTTLRTICTGSSSRSTGTLNSGLHTELYAGACEVAADPVASWYIPCRYALLGAPPPWLLMDRK